LKKHVLEANPYGMGAYHTVSAWRSVKLKVKQTTYKALMVWPNIQRSNVRSTIIVQNPRHSCLQLCSHEAKIIKELDMISHIGLINDMHMQQEYYSVIIETHTQNDWRTQYRTYTDYRTHHT
jgi:hypothetical protein